MAKDASFDVVSEVDRQEVDNALNQAKKEISQRFDFKGTDASIEWTEELKIEIRANAEDRCTAAIEVFQEKCIRRQVPWKSIKASEIKPTGGKSFKIDIEVLKGIADDKAREITKALKQKNIKGVQIAIQGDQLRVTGKSRDALQEAIAFLKESDFGIALQFTNYR